ncbi:MAG: DMT family transporter [Pseudomonadota bacterium]
MTIQRADSRRAGGTTMKIALLALLGLLWAVRIAAIKAVGLSGVPVHVVVSVAALGLAALFSVGAVVRSSWPPMDRELLIFYVLTGVLGFLAPFALESAVAPHLTVFVFLVVIATMPIMTLVLSILTGGERFALRPILAVLLGFACAVAILWDTTSATGDATGSWWVAAAFGVPLLYALNTVFVARRFPARAGAVQVAHAQALIVGTAALLGMLATGAAEDLTLARLDPVALGVIIAGEALALLAYLRITRDYGATWVSFANYVSMIVGAVIGAWLFGDRIGVLTIVAALGIIGSVTLYQRRAR